MPELIAFAAAVIADGGGNGEHGGQGDHHQAGCNHQPALLSVCCGILVPHREEFEHG